jgi:hypothetical protein
MSDWHSHDRRITHNRRAGVLERTGSGEEDAFARLQEPAFSEWLNGADDEVYGSL